MQNTIKSRKEDEYQVWKRDAGKASHGVLELLVAEVKKYMFKEEVENYRFLRYWIRNEPQFLTKYDGYDAFMEDWRRIKRSYQLVQIGHIPREYTKQSLIQLISGNMYGCEFIEAS